MFFIFSYNCNGYLFSFYYNTILYRYPSRMMNRVMVPKNIPIKRHVMTFLSIVASGKDSPTTAIMNARAVPMGTPFATNTSMTGTIPAALAYIGTPKMTDNGTANQLLFDMYSWKNPSGT